jgi:hypothetical protein
MNEAVRTALISAVVAIITAAISAFTTMAVKRAELDAASSTAKKTQQKTGELLNEVKQAEQQLAAVAPNWVRARLEPGWSVYGSTYSDPSYTKDQLGFVHLRGLAKAGGQGNKNPLMLLPNGFRPEYRMEVVVSCAGNTPCETIIEPDGQIWFETWNSGWVGLDNISFAAAQSPNG